MKNIVLTIVFVLFSINCSSDPSPSGVKGRLIEKTCLIITNNCNVSKLSYIAECKCNYQFLLSTTPWNSPWKSRNHKCRVSKEVYDSISIGDLYWCGYKKDKEPEAWRNSQ